MSVWLRRSSPIAPAASRASAIASPMPASAAATGSGWSIIWRQALDSASRWPARLPLSTDDTYSGSSRRRSRVSYQLYRCPRKRSRLPTVASVASRRSTISSVPIQPKSRAVTVASRYIPMFVGEVRCATTGPGSSWKLSGGSPWSSGPTNVSKNRQVRRAVRRSGLDVGGRELLGGRLGGRQADPPGDEGREQPQDDERRGDPARAPASRRGRGPRRRRRSRRRPPSAGRTRRGRGRGWPWPAPRSSTRGGSAG